MVQVQGSVWVTDLASEGQWAVCWAQQAAASLRAALEREQEVARKEGHFQMWPCLEAQ